MILKLKYFGMIAEATKVTEESIEQSCSSVQELLDLLIIKYPALKDLNYKVAVNHNIVNYDFKLTGDEEVALLPPFAGG